MNPLRALLAAAIAATAAAASAHTMIQMAAYDITRDIQVTSTALTISYDARVTSDTQLPLVQPYLDTDNDGHITDHDVVTMSRLCLENLGLDLAVYLNNDLLQTTTVSQQLHGGGRIGFALGTHTSLPPRPPAITTETITIIDPAYMFPPLDQNRQWKTTTISTTSPTHLVKDNNTTATTHTMESTPTNIILITRP